MPKIKQASPISESSVLSSTSIIHRGMQAPEHRPYLVTPLQPKQALPIQRSLPLFPHESEDARLTGETRSLFRRLLALNLPKTAAAALPAPSIAKSAGSIFASPKIA
jgi:hypothetical protein